MVVGAELAGSLPLLAVLFLIHIAVGSTEDLLGLFMCIPKICSLDKTELAEESNSLADRAEESSLMDYFQALSLHSALSPSQNWTPVQLKIFWEFRL